MISLNVHFASFNQTDCLFFVGAEQGEPVKLNQRKILTNLICDLSKTQQQIAAKQIF